MVDTAEQPPYPLDFLQTIVNVSWAKGHDIIVVRLRFSQANSSNKVFPVGITNMNWAPNVPFNGNSSPIGPKPNTAVVNPISKDMLAGLYSWASPQSSDGTFVTALIFINATLIRKDFKGKCSFLVQTTQSATQTAPPPPAKPIYFAWLSGGWAPMQLPDASNYNLPSKYYYTIFQGGVNAEFADPSGNIPPGGTGIPILECSGAGLGVANTAIFDQIPETKGIYTGFPPPVNNQFISLAAAQAFATCNNILNQPPADSHGGTSAALLDPITGAFFSYLGPVSGDFVPMVAGTINPSGGGPPVTVSGAQSWVVDVSNFTENLSFPYDGSNNPLWTAKPVASKEIAKSSSTGLPASVISVTDPASKVLVSGG